MSSAIVIACKSCGAKLTIGDEPQIICTYCGTPNIVPEELRPQKPQPVAAIQPQVIVVQSNPETVRRVAAVTTTVAAGTGILGCILPLIITAVVLIAVGAALLPVLSMPEILGPLQGVIPGAANLGFAKRVIAFGDEGTGPGFFQDARHVAVDGAGNVYVSDLNTQRIQRFDKDGKFVSFWTIEEKSAAKLGPGRIAADQSGTVYALWDRSILKYEGASGKLLGKLTGEVFNRAANLTEEIHDFAVLPNGQVWAIASATANDDLVRFDKDGKVVKRIPKAVSTPKNESVFASSLRLAVDGLGNIFIADSFPSKPAIYKFSPEGTYLNKFGSRGDKPGQFTSAPGYLAVDGKSRVFAIDFGRVHVFDGEGRYVDVIGGAAFDNVVYDIAASGTDLYVVGRNKVYKLAVNDAAGK